MSDPNTGNDRTGDNSAGNDTRSLAELEADIARTREQLGRDVEGIAYKLSPERFKEYAQETLQGTQEAVMDTVNEMAENVVEKTREAGTSFTDMIRRHPLPTALIGAGVALLAVGGGVSVSRARDDDDEVYTGYGSRYGYGEGEYGGYVRPGYETEPSASTGHVTQGYGSARSLDYGAYDSGYDTGSYNTGSYAPGSYNLEGSSGSGYASDRAGDDSGSWLQGVQSFGDRAGGAGQQAGRKAKEAGRDLADFIEEQPLIAGLVTVALGAVIGLSLPGTRREDELMGSTRDQLAGQAKEVAGRAREVAQRTFDEAKETAKQEFGKVQEDAKAGAKNLVEESKEAAKKVAEDTKNTAKEQSDKQNLR
jgi:ElaB/YqjD/DUF883 family membrane-anchored ribosome-binding protein